MAFACHPRFAVKGDGALHILERSFFRVALPNDYTIHAQRIGNETMRVLFDHDFECAGHGGNCSGRTRVSEFWLLLLLRLLICIFIRTLWTHFFHCQNSVRSFTLQLRSSGPPIARCPQRFVVITVAKEEP
jgi:hypothetical protein